MVRRAKHLRNVWSNDLLFSVERDFEDIQFGTDWIRPLTSMDETTNQMRGILGFEGSQDWHEHDLMDILSNIGGELFRLKQWSESVNWLEMAIPLWKEDKFAQLVGPDHMLVHPDERLAELTELWFEGRWFKGLARLEANYAEFEHAIELAQRSVTAYEEWFTEVERPESEFEEWEGAGHPQTRDRCTENIRELRRWIATWTRKADGRKN